jgi:predicted ATPase
LLCHLLDRRGEVVGRLELEREVWGFRVGVRSDAVPVCVRRLRKKIGEHWIETLRGIGWRLRAPVTPTSRIDRAENAFVGRTTELERIDRSFAGDARVVSLVGPGGVGKSRLAREWACGRDIRTIRVPLQAVHTREEVVGAVARALGVTQPQGDPEEVIGTVLQTGGAALLVFDDAERVLAHLRELLARWLSVRARCRFLVTSRERMRLAGEEVVQVDRLDTRDAVRLFEARVQAAGYIPDPGAEAELVDVLDRLPLAIELAAARAALLPARAMVGMLQDRFRLLSSAGGPRRQNLEGCIRWSTESLGDTARDAFEQLSVFEGPFSLDDAEQVLDIPPDAWMLDVLQSLVEKSLVVRLQDGRLQLLHSMRAYGRIELQRRDRWADLQQRHLRWYARLGTVERARRQFLDPRRDVLENLEGTREELEAALRAMTVPTEDTRAVARALWMLARQAGLASGSCDGIRRALHPATCALDEAILLEMSRVMDHPDDWLELARDSDSTEPLVVLERIRSFRRLGWHLRAVDLLQAALERAPEPAVQGDLLLQQGLLANAAGDHEQTIRALEAALTMHEAHENRRGQAACLVELACYGRPRRLDLVQRAHQVIRAERLDFLEPRCWNVLVSIAIEGAADSRPLVVDARDRMLGLGRPQEAAMFTTRLGQLASLAGDPASARAHLEEAIRVLRPHGGPRLAASLADLAQVHAEFGDLDTALRRAREAVALLPETGNPLHHAVIGAHLVMVHRYRGEHEQARGVLGTLPSGSSPAVRDLQPLILEHAFLALHDGAFERAAALLEALPPASSYLREIANARLAVARGPDASAAVLAAWTHPSLPPGSRSAAQVASLAQEAGVDLPNPPGGIVRRPQ